MATDLAGARLRLSGAQETLVVINVTRMGHNGFPKGVSCRTTVTAADLERSSQHRKTSHLHRLVTDHASEVKLSGGLV